MHMLFKPRQSFLYFLKKIQFSITTWKNAVEIARAYTGPKDTVIRHIPFPPRILAIIIYTIIGAIVVSGVMWFLVVHKPGLLHLRFTGKTKNVTIPEKLNSLVPPPPPFEKPSKPLPVVDSVAIDTTVETKADSVPVADTTEIAVDTAVPMDAITRPSIPKPDVPLSNYDTPTDDTASFLILVANKAFKAIFVLQKKNDGWKPVREYDIAIGAQEGRKMVAGDQRTPEGYYNIVGRKEKRELNIIYGPLAYVLNYPNAEDQRAGRTGEGIWIHGTNPDSVPVDTKGCLEMKNDALRELSTLLGGGIGTPIVIVNDTDLTDPARIPDYPKCIDRRRIVLSEYRRMQEQFTLLLKSWKSAWETKNIAEYETFYDTAQFFGQGLHWDGWKERKLRTFDLYDTIAISVDRIFIADYSGEEVVVKFLQDYTTNLREIKNGKKLSFEKVNDFWKITGESTCPIEELPL